MAEPSPIVVDLCAPPYDARPGEDILARLQAAIDRLAERPRRKGSAAEDE